MANEIANLNSAIADVSGKLNTATARVAALEARSSDGVPAADVQLAADAVAALGPRIDALAPSIAPSS